MKIKQYQCDVCGGKHQMESDMIYGYSMKPSNLLNELTFIEKDRTNLHICIDCINAIKITPFPKNLL
jgi:hypothetical protein